MVAGGFTLELKTSASPASLWKAAVTDFHVFVPKLAPELIASVGIAEGDGCVGTVKVTTFTPAVKDATVYKLRVEEMDERNYHYAHSIVEGEKKHYQSSLYTYKFKPAEDGGSLCTITGKFKTVGDHDPTEEKMIVKEGFVAMFKAIDAYLQAHPDECA